MTDVEDLYKAYIEELVEGDHFKDAVTNSAIKRLMWKAGVVRLPGNTTHEVRLLMANELYKVVKRLLVLHNYQKHSTITADQLKLVLKLDGYILAASEPQLQQASKSSKKKDPKKKGAARAKQGRVALRNVKATQKTTGLLIRASPFERLVRYIADPKSERDSNDNKLRFAQHVIRLIQLYIETYVVKVLKAASLVAKVTGLKGVQPIHIATALEVSDVLDH